MSFIKSAIIGGGLAFVLGIVGLIPIVNLCVCFVNPLIMVLAGYALCSFTGIKAGDYGALGINLLVYSFAGAVVGAILGFLLQMFGLGMGAVGGADLTQLGLTAAGGVVGIIIGFIFQMIMMFILAAVGGLIYMFTKK
jgi:hypothetical protein